MKPTKETATNWEKCHECGEDMTASDVYVLGEYHEIGGFCNNEKCGRYLLLVV